MSRLWPLGTAQPDLHRKPARRVTGDDVAMLYSLRAALKISINEARHFATDLGFALSYMDSARREGYVAGADGAA